jgi:competence ComEA-like helix-hairpin-helix protein
MRITSGVVPVVAMAAAVGLWMASALHAQQGAGQPPSPPAAAESEFPEDGGREMFITACSGCHEAAIATESRRTREDWNMVIVSMQDRGATLTEAEVKAVADYLTEHFGTTLNLNKARAKEIAGFLKLSPEEAAAIVRFRGASGPFKTWDDLAMVPGLDIKKIEGRKDTITF